ncbi:uncharacterized protein F4822DRAFT_162185 [Hypoxylon trugodes]|uniref:uncharacterized protein n=1 Tax=Hypoxylon trugodes TaxID=326681 RepID=UPI00219D21A2|nr:uncharacterized protein F4822DRAFT_162185 [Hypoxylon trugodes]KAI1390717.1 hypothetical protein F4822DRAFT_162185 [Hypoxylon trugodes]
MSTNEEPDLCSATPAHKGLSREQRRCLRLWKRSLVFDVTSTSPTNDKSAKVVGLIDGGSEYCLISSGIIKKLGITMYPLSPEDQPTLEGYKGKSFKPACWAQVKLKQSDLSLEAWMTVYVIQDPKVTLLLGSVFNHEYGIETTISDAVNNTIEPRDRDEQHMAKNIVAAIIDTRSQSQQKKEEDEKRQGANKETIKVYQEIEDIKRNLQLGSGAELTMRNKSFLRNPPTSLSDSSTASPSTSSWSASTLQSTANTSVPTESRDENKK